MDVSNLFPEYSMNHWQLFDRRIADLQFSSTVIKISNKQIEIIRSQNKRELKELTVS
jgi:hypothetical protein